MKFSFKMNKKKISDTQNFHWKFMAVAQKSPSDLLDRVPRISVFWSGYIEQGLGF